MPTPTTPTANRQDLDQERLPTRNMSLESLHISAKYIRYLKLLKGKSVTITNLGIFSQFDGIRSSIENVVTSTFQAIQNCFHKETPVKSLEYLANCNFANLMVYRTKRLSFNRNISSKTKFFGKKTYLNLQELRSTSKQSTFRPEIKILLLDMT